MILAGLFFLGHAWFLSRAQGFGAVDDAWIAFRYVQQLLLGHGLEFNPGEYVEGYSSLLWVLLLAGLNRLGLEVLTASLLAGTLCGLLVLLLAARLASQLLPGSHARVWVAWFLALDGGFVRWAVDGLETQLFALLLLLAARNLLYNKPIGVVKEDSLRLGQAVQAGGWLGLAALTRPEGLGFVGLFAVWCFGRTYWFAGSDGASAGRGRVETTAVPAGGEGGAAAMWARFLRPVSGSAAVFWLGLSAACCIVPHLLWRHVTYGEWVANTALLKVEPGLVSSIRGIRYGLMFVWERWPLLLGFVLLGWMGRTSAPLMSARARVFLAWLVLGMVGSTVLVGGDWMGWSRFFVPVLAFLYLAALGQVWREGASGGAARWARGVTLAGMALGLFLASSWFGERPRLKQAGIEHAERDVIATYLKQHAGPADRILTEELGEIPFKTGLFALDVYGLIDPHIARFGAWDPDSPPGHQKTELNYSLSRSPDWLVMAGFHSVWERHVRAGPGDSLRFPALRRYAPVPLTLPEGRLELYRLVK